MAPHFACPLRFRVGMDPAFMYSQHAIQESCHLLRNVSKGTDPRPLFLNLTFRRLMSTIFDVPHR